jgi:hypothetical protein
MVLLSIGRPKKGQGVFPGERALAFVFVDSRTHPPLKDLASENLEKK